MGTMERILRLMAERQASDVYLSPKAAALIRINGQCMPINGQVLPVSAPLELLREIIDEKRMAEFERTGELNTAVPLRDVGSFRVSAMRQRGSCAVVVRFIPVTVPSFETLALPPVLKTLIMERRGLILMVGATGSGKSTTLASMIDLRNESTPGHILTIEEPIEFAFQNKKSVINQREVGNDTATLETALKNALRQAPDVILIGEIRDRETMTAALAYAQSGHLVLATLHANNAYRALNRIQSFYPLETRGTLLNDMASGLRAVIAQRLLRTPQGARVPAVEVMLNTALVRDLIERGDFDGIKDAMEHSMAEGSQTFEEAIAKLVLEGKVSRDEALVHADSPANLMWRLQNENRPRDGASAKGGEPSLMQQTEAPTFTDITLDVHPG